MVLFINSFNHSSIYFLNALCSNGYDEIRCKKVTVTMTLAKRSRDGVMMGIRSEEEKSTWIESHSHSSSSSWQTLVNSLHAIDVCEFVCTIFSLCIFHFRSVDVCMYYEVKTKKKTLTEWTGTSVTPHENATTQITHAHTKYALLSAFYSYFFCFLTAHTSRAQNCHAYRAIICLSCFAHSIGLRFCQYTLTLSRGIAYSIITVCSCVQICRHFFCHWYGAHRLYVTTHITPIKSLAIY